MTNSKWQIAILFLATFGYSLGVSAASDAQRIDEMEAQLQAQRALMEQQQRMLEKMSAELELLKANRTAASPPTKVEAGQSESGHVLSNTPVPGTAEPAMSVAAATKPEASKTPRLSAQVYGFAQADAIYDFKQVDPNWTDTLRVSTIPTQSGTYGNDGDFVFSVRQSRLGIKGDYGDDVTFLLEGELFGVGADEGQTTLRVRHAWATYRNLGMGQTWSNFMDIDIFPNTIDYWGPTGMVFYRNQQARYTFATGADEFAISIEDPSTALSVGRFRDTTVCNLPNPPEDCESSGSTAEDLFQSYNELPDLTGRYRKNGDFGHFQVAGIVRHLGYERLDTGAKGDEIGWGINTSASLKTFGQDRLKLQVAYGEGIGNYMNDGGLDIAPDSADISTASAETIPLLGISAYYDHYWNQQWSTSIGWSMTDLDTTAGQAPGEFKRGQIAQVNVLHHPTDNVMLGTEFLWGEREDVSGARGTDYRIQFSLKVNFDTGNLMQAR
ncbi:DcaP family trimeric outer membrane transporter [Candidatus Litorirhabdus singularis]|uniref:DcaP family trimeric outer membrane transporter n=1 Tax=Candidatus Litorirhabdus singularis TaxID=2518993 RepID=UPI00242A901A|nr:DcaP family trimeric outer membrane transporter [Candidatus Litorirhabdus singularis]